MLINVFLDFDDTLFPSNFMSAFYHSDKCMFVPPELILKKIHKMDKLISNFIIKHISYCRFRIVTHASKRWIYQALEMMPILQRYIEWHYVTIISCEAQITKEDTLYDIISREKSTDMYFCCGDSKPDVTAVPNIVKHLGLKVKLRTLLFVTKPSIEKLQFQWEKIHELFLDLVKDEQIEIHRHFVTTDDCIHYSDPALYNIHTIDSTFSTVIHKTTSTSPVIPQQLLEDASSYSSSFLLKNFPYVNSLQYNKDNSTNTENLENIDTSLTSKESFEAFPVSPIANLPSTIFQTLRLKKSPKIQTTLEAIDEHNDP